MNLEAIEPVRDCRAGGTGGGVVGSEHQVVNKELRAPSKEVRKSSLSLVGLKSVAFLNPNPRQLLPHQRQLVAAPRVFLLRLEQLEPRRKPLFTCSYLMLYLLCTHTDILLSIPFERPEPTARGCSGYHDRCKTRWAHCDTSPLSFFLLTLLVLICFRRGDSPYWQLPTEGASRAVPGNV